MPISLAEVAANSAFVDVPWGDDPKALRVEYYPGRVTEKALAIANTSSANDLPTILAGFQEFNAVLAMMLKSWDLYEDTERTALFPLEAKEFPRIPIALRAAIFGAIIRAFRPNTEATQEN